MQYRFRYETPLSYAAQFNPSAVKTRAADLGLGYSAQLKGTVDLGGKVISYHIFKKPGHMGPPTEFIGRPGDLYIGSKGELYLHRKGLWQDVISDKDVLYRHPTHQDFVLYIGEDKVNPAWVPARDLFRADLRNAQVRRAEYLAESVIMVSKDHYHCPGTMDHSATHPPSTSTKLICFNSVSHEVEKVPERTYSDANTFTDGLSIDPESLTGRKLCVDIIQQIDSILDALHVEGKP